MTDAETRLWQALRRNQLGGLAFRRQHPVGNYVLDFYCPALALAIEVDGGQHNMTARNAADRARTALLNARGILVLRYWNNDVLMNLSGVLDDIMRAAAQRAFARGKVLVEPENTTPPRRAPRVDPPLSGEGYGNTGPTRGDTQ